MNKKRYVDPYAEDEAKKYANPVPSRKFLLELLEEIGVPIGFKALLKRLALKEDSEQEGLRRRLKAMVRDAELMRDRKNRFCLIDKLELVRGTVQGHTDGYGFLLAEKLGQDYYIAANQMRHVLHGDKVLARIFKNKTGKWEVKIREIIQKTVEIIGTVEKNEELIYVKPTNTAISHNIFLSKEDLNKVNKGMLVIVNLVTHPFDSPQVLGKIVHILGDYMDPGLEVDITIHNNQIPNVWSDDILRETNQLKNLSFKKHGEDHTNLPFITIDGADAKDLDDAVFCEKQGVDWILYVAIADVSHYVKPDSLVDLEAKNRGNSTYFPNRVVPMLPSVLSNDLCSLNPNENKAVLICKMKISRFGNLSSAKFVESTICSKARLSYQQVADFYNGEDLVDFTSGVKENLLNLYDLYKRLSEQRKKRHAIELEIPENKIIFSEQKKIEKIILSSRNVAHKIIEECMLMANVAAADLVNRENLPCLYRNHNKADPEILNDLANQFSMVGVKVPNGITTNEDFSEIIEQIKLRDDAGLLQMLILCSMQQANYTHECLGHFGLALEKYTHFTSPIRRYPDLIVHRVICNYLNKEKRQISIDELSEMGAHCSMTERRSEAAEREVISWLKCEYMLEHVGNEYMGTISSITDFGLFVTLNEYYVDGLVHVTSLKNDYYKYEQSKLRLVGKRTGTKYQFGENIKVIVTNVDLDRRRIDFSLA